MSDYNCLSETDYSDFTETSCSEDEDVSEYECNSSSDSESDNLVTQADIVKLVSIMKSMLSKDGKIEWMFEPPADKGRSGLENIIKCAPGVTRYAIVRVLSIKNTFKLVFNTTIQNIIIQMTNIRGQRVYRAK